MKTKLDKWDCQVILYCKHWFDKNKDGNPRENINKVNDLCMIYSKRYCIDLKYVHADDIFLYLLHDIVEPFIMPVNPRVFQKVVENSHPRNCWRVGYMGGFIYNEPRASTVEFPYNYYDAVVYVMASIIALTEIKDFTDFPENLKADLRLIDPEFKPDYNSEYNE